MGRFRRERGGEGRGGEKGSGGKERRGGEGRRREEGWSENWVELILPFICVTLSERIKLSGESLDM